MLHRVVLGVASQVLEHLPPRPVASATYVIEDLGEPVAGADRELATGAATVSNVVITLDANAGPGEADSRRIPVTSTTGWSRGAWWIESTSGIGEAVWIEGFELDDSLVARWPLAGSYETGDTLVPLAISAAFPDVVAADDDYIGEDLRVVWSYTLDSRSQVAQDQIRIARQTTIDVSVHEVVEFVGAFAPDLAGRFRVGELARWAELAIKLVASRGRAEGIELTRWMFGDRAIEIVAWRTMIILAENGYAPGQIDADKFGAAMVKNFDRNWQALTTGAPGLEVVAVDDDDDAVKPKEAYGLNFGL